MTHLGKMDLIFSALGDQTRRKMIESLSHHKTCTAAQLAAPFSISLPAISKHLKILENAQLIHRDVQGRTHYFSLRVQALEQVSEWLRFHQSYWEQSLSKMEKFLTNKSKNKKGK